MSELHISISAEPVFHFFGITVTNSILTTWVIVGLLVLFAITFSKKLKISQTSRLQAMVEFLIESTFGVVESIAGYTKARKFYPLIGAFFFFIIFSNWSGILPGAGTIGYQGMLHGETTFIPFFRAPTADVNTTLALSLVSMVSVQIFGLQYLGFKYLKKFFDFSSPINFFVGFLEIISEFSKIISFTFRLFGNIVAGEILLLVMAMIVPAFGPTPFIGLELFVGMIQALVFMMLSAVFVNMATSGHGDEH